MRTITTTYLYIYALYPCRPYGCKIRIFEIQIFSAHFSFKRNVNTTACTFYSLVKRLSKEKHCLVKLTVKGNITRGINCVRIGNYSVEYTRINEIQFHIDNFCVSIIYWSDCSSMTVLIRCETNILGAWNAIKKVKNEFGLFEHNFHCKEETILSGFLGV